MIDFLRRLFLVDKTDRAQKGVADSDPCKVLSMPADATETELDYVRETLDRFKELGLHRNSQGITTLPEYANAVVAGYPNDAISVEELSDSESANRITANANFPRLTVLWVSENEETGKEIDYFSNVYLFPDHCFDVAVPRDYERLMNRIFSLPGRDWSPKLLEINNPKITIKFQHETEIETITIDNGKDFDLSLFSTLNSLVPEQVDGRFGYLADGGNVLVVWLPPQKFPEFNTYCGIDFYNQQ